MCTVAARIRYFILVLRMEAVIRLDWANVVAAMYEFCTHEAV